MIEQLFGSKTRVKLLQLFYSNPNRSFYVREITRKVEEQINSVRRELANLLSIGIIVSDTTNNRLYYEVNQGYEYYASLLAVFGQSKSSTSVAESTAQKAPSVSPEKEQFRALGNVELAIYTGQFTRDESSGIDLMIVGDVNHNALHKFVADLEKREGKEIRYTLMPLDEFRYRRQIKDRFINAVLDAKKQILVDRDGLLEGK